MELLSVSLNSFLQIFKFFQASKVPVNLLIFNYFWSAAMIELIACISFCISPKGIISIWLHKGGARSQFHFQRHQTWNDLWPLFGGAGAIFLSLAAEARVTRVLIDFAECGDDGTFTGFDRSTSVRVTDVEDGVVIAVVVVVCCNGRSNSAIASWIAFSSWEFNFRLLFPYFTKWIDKNEFLVLLFFWRNLNSVEKFVASCKFQYFWIIYGILTWNT